MFVLLLKLFPMFEGEKMMTFEINRRDGLYSLIKTARELCAFIVKFEPVIRRLYPTNTELHDALGTALTACAALEALCSEQKQQGE
ncbi:MAG TPA: hypothetical protein VFM05_15580 [Candidatus Saccharimonadales bacterium]|nr:hypothetical protein [Candidatus Saccharimonadales bacterium]